jgi:hypothetical protein
MMQLYFWNKCASVRQRMLEAYNPYESIQRVGVVHFSTYLQTLIGRNPRLSAGEKAQIIEKFTEMNENRWTRAETLHRFERLAMVMLGILRKKNT